MCKMDKNTANGNGNADVSQQAPNDSTTPPPLSALFLIEFDRKVGYNIVWSRACSGVSLEGVEFKSLPSGLHAVKKDLVYFIQDQYAGLSAFSNKPATESERNAHLVALGTLVALSHGRLGRSWLHAQRLEQLASTLVNKKSELDILEKFWEANKVDSGKDFDAENAAQSSLASSSKKNCRARALSRVTAFTPSLQTLPAYHPALSILDYIGVFGPLVFPLHRISLLRKRILIIGAAPVRKTCEYVFNLSILSSLPVSSLELLPNDVENLNRLRSLFSIGVHDIPMLEDEAKKLNDFSISEDSAVEIGGWVACTTDEVLKMKHNLYDFVVELPDATRRPDGSKLWPKILDSKGIELKATLRDVQRWKLLHVELQKTIRQYSLSNNQQTDAAGSDNENEYAALLTGQDQDSREGTEASCDERLVEPMTWSQLAYSGFMWWASAGETDETLDEQFQRDNELLGNLADYIAPEPYASSAKDDEDDNNGLAAHLSQNAGLHTAIIAYFHRLTSCIISTLAESIEIAGTYEDQHESTSEGVKRLFLASDELTQMGLDTWSPKDQKFAREISELYWGVDANVKGAGLECCGVRIC